MGFYVHTDMHFVVTERRQDSKKAPAKLIEGLGGEANALPWAYDA